MSDLPSPVAAEKIRAALDFVPEQLAEWVHLADHAGVGGIGVTADHLVKYAVARLLHDDPGLEERDTWAALRSAADVAAAQAEALNAAPGDDVSVWVDYLDAGYGIRVGSQDVTGDGPAPGVWLRAFALALVFGGRVPRPPSDPHARALADLHRGRPVDPDGVASPALRALVRGDHAACVAELRAAFARHEADHRGDLLTLLPWDLLAVAILAHRRGVPVEIDSVHCPPRLVTAAGPLVEVPDGPVPRPVLHAGFATRLLKRLEQDAPDALDALFDRTFQQGWNAARFAEFGHARLSAFALRSREDPEAADVRQWTELVLARQAFTAVFALLAAEPGTGLTVTVGDRTGVLFAEGPQGGGRWRYSDAVALAMITRDEAALTSLAGASPGLTRKGGASAAGALRAHLAGTGVRAEGAGTTDRADDEHECLHLPVFRLLEALEDDDRAGFDARLAEALVLHRQYFSLAPRRSSPEALVAPRPLGLACRAHDRGWEVGVASDYLPRRIVEGTWVGTPPDLARFRAV
ncbi:Imm49 family immunity protein [Actinomadura kijaniata]|uniref:immunity 49 family protein n=1 Tax=Actinomadura kijaniata TaxID=46161 RepID=UPI003F1B49C6